MYNFNPFNIVLLSMLEASNETLKTTMITALYVNIFMWNSVYEFK